MFGRRVAETVRPGIVSPQSDAGRSGEKRMDDDGRHAREAFGHAGRHEDAFVAIDRRRCLRRTTRHIVRHLVGRRRRRHLIRHGLHRHVGRRRRHHRPGNWSQGKANDHQNREQPADGEVSVHEPRISQIGGDGKLTDLLPRLQSAGADRYQIVKRALSLDYRSDRPITAISSEIFAR